MRHMKALHLFLVLTILLGMTGIFTPTATAAKPKIYALLVVMGADPRNSEQYNKNQAMLTDLLERVKNKNVCELAVTILNSDDTGGAKKPSPDAILEWIDTLIPAKNDVVFIYYCGHGGRITGKPGDGTYFDITGANVFRTDIVSALKSSQAWACRLKMLVTDTCATETMNIETPETAFGTSSAASYKAERAYTQLFVEHEGFLHISSATEDEYSWGDSTNGGWFTNALVASINSHADADSRFVGWNEIFMAAENRVDEFIAENSEHVGEKIQHPSKYSEFPKPLRSASDLARWNNRENNDRTPSEQDDLQGDTRIRKITPQVTAITDEMPLQRLQIKVQFTVENSTADEVKVQAYFFHQDGKILKDLDSDSEKRYGTVGRQAQVVTAEQVKVNANKTTLSIPISQLHLPRGKKYALEIVCVLRDLNGDELTRSTRSFELTR